MKIWIQSTPRSGSTSFYGALSEILEVKWLAEEPLNPRNNELHKHKYPQSKLSFWLDSKTKSFLVKNQVFDYPTEIIKEKPFLLDGETWTKSNTYNQYLDFHKKISNVIDTSIILGRKNVYQTALSIAVAGKTGNWSDPYLTHDSDNDLVTPRYINQATFQKNLLFELAETVYKKDIIWYEDVFSRDIEIRKNILKKINLYKYLSVKQVDRYLEKTDPIGKYSRKKKSGLI